jgi:hypothetical protein
MQDPKFNIHREHPQERVEGDGPSSVHGDLCSYYI